MRIAEALGISPKTEEPRFSSKAERARYYARRASSVLAVLKVLESNKLHAPQDQHAAYDVNQKKRERWMEQRDAEVREHHEAAQDGRTVSKDRAELLAETTADAGADWESDKADLHQKSLFSDWSQKALNGAYDALNVVGENLKLAKVEVVKGDAAQFAADAQADAAAEQRLDEIEQRAAEPKATFLAKVKANLASLKGDGPLFKVTRQGNVHPDWIKIPDVVARGDKIPVMPPAVAMHLRDPENFQAAEREIEAQVDDLYRDITLTMTAEEKKAAHIKRTANILSANRRECAAIWALKRAGHRAYFRPGLSPFAVLGIEVPSPKRR